MYSGGQSEHFATTHWTLILEAAQAPPTRAAEALEKLCRLYWKPLYCHARRRGYAEADAEDLTQGFITQFIARSSVSSADPNRGRFRTFLLTSFERFIITEWRKARAQKRGASVPSTPLESMATSEPHVLPTCEEFDRAWAEEVFAAALRRLREEFVAARQEEQFLELRRFLSQPGDRQQYAHAGRKLHLKPETVAVLVHRTRRRYYELVRTQVSQTVETSEIDQELKYLVEIMAR